MTGCLNNNYSLNNHKKFILIFIVGFDDYMVYLDDDDGSVDLFSQCMALFWVGTIRYPCTFDEVAFRISRTTWQLLISSNYVTPTQMYIIQLAHFRHRYNIIKHKKLINLSFQKLCSHTAMINKFPLDIHMCKCYGIVVCMMVALIWLCNPE